MLPVFLTRLPLLKRTSPVFLTSLPLFKSTLPVFRSTSPAFQTTWPSPSHLRAGTGRLFCQGSGSIATAFLMRLA